MVIQLPILFAAGVQDDDLVELPVLDEIVFIVVIALPAAGIISQVDGGDAGDLHVWHAFIRSAFSIKVVIAEPLCQVCAFQWFEFRPIREAEIDHRPVVIAQQRTDDAQAGSGVIIPGDSRIRRVMKFIPQLLVAVDLAAIRGDLDGGFNRLFHCGFIGSFNGFCDCSSRAAFAAEISPFLAFAAIRKDAHTVLPAAGIFADFQRSAVLLAEDGSRVGHANFLLLSLRQHAGTGSQEHRRQYQSKNHLSFHGNLPKRHNINQFDHPGKLVGFVNRISI